MSLPDFLVDGDKEALDPELVEYLEEVEGLGTVLRHPLVYQVPYHPMMNKLSNYSLHCKREAVEQARLERDWSRFIFLHERPYRPRAFMEIADDLTGPEYWDHLNSVYVDTENLRSWAADLGTLVLRHPGHRSHFMAEFDAAALAEMPDVLTIYRGCNAPRLRTAFSWTLDRKRAEWFARRFSHRGGRLMVLTGEVNRDDVIGYISTRGEEEVVCIPKTVRVINTEILK